ncbi:hypothetical protein C8R43DRAFT_949854 [Mycena crocata]|nr:hypothetical protein C8R43DRAFT_949854 [Mycena crocata]
MPFCLSVRHFPFRRTDREPDAILQHTSGPETSTPDNATATSHTARNVLKFSLKTLSTVSSNIPFGVILSSIIDPLLDIADRIEQTSANKQGLAELAARIELLAPIVSEMAEHNPMRGRKMVEALEREIKSIAEDLSAACERGQLNQFFSSADTASSLVKHNSVLAQLMADSTFASVHEVLKFIDLERSKLLLSLSSGSDDGQFEAGDIKGGIGGTGGNARVGGDGGGGEGPRLEMVSGRRWTVGNISGGTGGAGGTGVDVGGKGGTGKAPVISVVRGAMQNVS